MSLPKFKDIMKADMKSTFVNGDFTVEAIYQVGNDPKPVTVHFFKDALDKMETLYSHIWCAFEDVRYIKKNEQFIIDNVKYGVVDFTHDEHKMGVDIFLSEV